MEKLLRVGVITSTHGLRGEVKIFPTTFDPHRFDELQDVLIGDEDRQVPARISRVRYAKPFVIAAFAGIGRIEEAEPYLKKDIYVTRENAAPLGENEYYVADLLGLQVSDETGRVLGVLKEVMPTGANDVYVVAGEDREILIPAIRQCILKIDLEHAQMLVRLMEGME